jgi:hypothetical protein
MNLARKMLLPVAAAAAVLAGTPAALAATSPGSMPAAAAPAATHLTAAYSPGATAIRWHDWGPYPTLKACNSEGDHLYLIYSILLWKCPALSGGEYIYYELFVVFGHGPGG